ncbi:hypothetical protein BJ546DRAFT_874205 [Cryomyces antarcticus]
MAVTRGRNMIDRRRIGRWAKNENGGGSSGTPERICWSVCVGCVRKGTSTKVCYVYCTTELEKGQA